MKNKLRQEKGITMMALVVTIIILLILTSVLVFNTQDSPGRLRRAGAAGGHGGRPLPAV